MSRFFLTSVFIREIMPFMSSIRPLLRVVPAEPVKSYSDGYIDGLGMGERMGDTRYFFAGAFAGLAFACVIAAIARYF